MGDQVENNKAGTIEEGRILSDARSIKPEEFVLGILLFLSVFSTGGLTIFLFDATNFMGMDTFKLCLLSSAITLPVFVFSLFFSDMILSSDIYKTKFTDHLIFACSQTCIIFYPSLLIRRFFDVSFNYFLLWLAVFCVISFFGFVAIFRDTK